LSGRDTGTWILAHYNLVKRKSERPAPGRDLWDVRLKPTCHGSARSSGTGAPRGRQHFRDCADRRVRTQEAARDVARPLGSAASAASASPVPGRSLVGTGRNGRGAVVRHPARRAPAGPPPTAPGLQLAAGSPSLLPALSTQEPVHLRTPREVLEHDAQKLNA
jgi:hypothetical protein